MSASQADAFIERLSADEAFAAEISGGVWESSEIAYAAVAGTVSVVAVGVIVASCASAAAAA